LDFLLPGDLVFGKRAHNPSAISSEILQGLMPFQSLRIAAIRNRAVNTLIVPRRIYILRR
jgi:hypothetical protein